MTSTDTVVPGTVTTRTFANVVDVALPNCAASRGFVSATVGVQDLVLAVDDISQFIPRSQNRDSSTGSDTTTAASKLSPGSRSDAGTPDQSDAAADDDDTSRDGELSYEAA